MNLTNSLSDAKLHLTPLDLGFDVWLFILSLLQVHDILRFRQVSKLFYELTKQRSLWITLYKQIQPSGTPPSSPSTDSIERFLKFHQNWTSPFPVPVEAPKTLPQALWLKHVGAVKFVKDECGASWLVVITELWISKTWPNDEVPDWAEDVSVNFIRVQAFLASDTEKHWEFGKWYCSGGEYQHSETRASWAFDEDDESPYVLALACADGFIHTYSLSSTTGWNCSRSTPMPTTPAKISFLTFSRDHVVAALGTWNDSTLALTVLHDSGTMTHLLSADGARLIASGNDGISARFSREHAIIFHYPSMHKDLFGHVYALRSTTQTQTHPIAGQRFPTGTKSAIFSHITTEDLVFPMLITYLLTPEVTNMELSQTERQGGLFQFNERTATYTTFSFAFSPQNLMTTLERQEDVPE
ncbi:hypothetical protein DL96DRAFT_1212876 [Flagelloscypha sp. PMI_526]|nr:hypothetical protein DL96DRAFT_1212876 [Flagelloscypha sp. PMI_526]